MIAQSTYISILTVLLIISSLLAFFVYRLYISNRTKALTLTEKLLELKNENDAKSELTQLLNNIFENSMHGILAFSSIRNEQNDIVDFECQMCNRNVGKILDVDTKMVVGGHLLTLFPGTKEAGLFDAYVELIQTNEPFYTNIYYNHDDIDRWFAINAVKNKDGVIVTFSDISDLKRNEKLLIEKHVALKEANKQLEQFAYIASHDLQEPLRKVTAFGGRLEKNYADKLDDRGKDFINRMISASNRMQTLIDDLLKFSRATKNETVLTVLDFNKVIDIVKDNLSEQITNSRAMLKIATLPMAHANQSQMVQLFQNLISNAMKYVHKDIAPQIDIAVSEVNVIVKGADLPFWQIAITDNGIGFDNADKEKIFEIFHRLHGRSNYSGTGIGLAICMKIVNNHNGFLFAHSHANSGATFTIQLPK